MASSFPAAKLPSGAQMPYMGLGTWKSQPGEVAAAVEHALKVGYRHLDCAWGYRNEPEVGLGIKGAIDKGYCKREDIFIVSKLWNTCHEPDMVEPLCKETLTNLGIDYLDLYLMHWPQAYEMSDLKDLEPKGADGKVKFSTREPIDTWSAMEGLVDKGICKDIGLSNFNSSQVQDILDKGKIKPATNQVEVHPYLGQEKLFQFCKERNITLTAYSPLASPDRPWATASSPKLLDDPKLMEVAKKYGKSTAQVILRWLLQRGIMVIPKSVTLCRIEENFNILDFELSQEDMETMASFECNGRLIFPQAVIGEHRDKDHPHYPFNIEF